MHQRRHVWIRRIHYLGRPLPSVFFYHLILADKYGYHQMFYDASADLLDLPDNYEGDSLDAETEKLAMHYKRIAEEYGKL